MSTWTIAGVQTDCRLADVAHNLAAVRAKLRDAAHHGAQLVVFPECALSGYCFASKDEARRAAEPLPGPATDALAADCRELNVWAVVGLLERAGDRLYNAAALVGPGGFVAAYRKAHLPCLGVDRFTDRGGEPFAVHDLGGLRVGMTICYDSSFPEASRVLALAGADLIVLPTNWPPQAEKTARVLVPARAMENRVYYAAVNRVGEERGFRFIGLSRVADVTGDLLAASDDDAETILYAQIDPERARRKRIVNIPGEYEVDRVRDRRPELYGPLTDRVR
ncbi:MAG TPA: carbon-nitrogen hydrolase family protein [Gemmataceae bacterium]|jgi:predicted amidohydrolase